MNIREILNFNLNVKSNDKTINVIKNDKKASMKIELVFYNNSVEMLLIDTSDNSIMIKETVNSIFSFNGNEYMLIENKLEKIIKIYNDYLDIITDVLNGDI